MLDKSESNGKKTVKPDTFYIVSDPVEFFLEIAEFSTAARDLDQKSIVLE